MEERIVDVYLKAEEKAKSLSEIEREVARSMWNVLSYCSDRKSDDCGCRRCIFNMPSGCYVKHVFTDKEADEETFFVNTVMAESFITPRGVTANG